MFIFTTLLNGVSKSNGNKCLIFSQLKFAMYFYYPFQGLIGLDQLKYNNEVRNPVPNAKTYKYEGGADDNLIH